MSSLAKKGHPSGHELCGETNGHTIAEQQTETHIATSRNHAREYGYRFVVQKNGSHDGCLAPPVSLRFSSAAVDLPRQEEAESMDLISFNAVPGQGTRD